MKSRVLVLPNIRIPREDGEALTHVIDFIADYRPDEVIQLGTVLDDAPFNAVVPPCTSERRRTLINNAERARDVLLSPIRRIHKGALSILVAAAGPSHTSQLPAREIVDVQLEQLLAFASYDIQAVPGCLRMGDGWVALIDDGPARAHSRIPGNVALNLAKRLGTSVLLGHTNRLGLASHRSTSQPSNTLLGVESGTLVNHHDAAFQSAGVGRWQLGFVTLEKHGTRTQPSVFLLRGKQRTLDRLPLVA